MRTRESRKRKGRTGQAGSVARKETRQKPPARDDRGKRLLDLVVLLLGARQPVPFREIRDQFRVYQTAKEDAGLRAFERDKADLIELGVPLRYVTPEEDDGIEEAGYIVDLRRYRDPPHRRRGGGARPGRLGGPRRLGDDVRRGGRPGLEEAGL